MVSKELGKEAKAAMQKEDRPGTAVPAIFHEVVERFAELPAVMAIALGGSYPTATADEQSDVDLYIFAEEEISPAVRAAIATDYDPLPEIDNRFFGPGDEWRDARTGVTFDLIYWAPRWLDEQLDRLLVHHHASVGYSTCFWHTARHAVPLYDRTGWLAALKAKAAQPYSEELRRAVVAMNHPVLRRTRSSFLHQIELAVSRRDAISVHHRVTALLASYVDVLFAINRLPHPGEKRLLAIALHACPLLPEAIEEEVTALITAVGTALDNGVVIARAHALIDGLDNLLRDEWFHMHRSRDDCEW